MMCKAELLLVTTAALALASTPAVAQDAQPEETIEAEWPENEVIIVTGTKRASTILDVPFSINAQTQEDIQRTGSQNLEDLSRNVAGLTIQNLGPGQSQVAIRGVSAGQIVRDQPGVKEQVGIYLDESVISLSLFTPDIDLFDLNRVETLRGPQGTLFGSGSVGGTIRYITNQPDPSVIEGLLEADLNAIDGGGVGGHLKGMINVPISQGNAAVRAVAYHTEYAGYIDALREGGGIDENVNSGHRTGGRVAFGWSPAANISIEPRILYQEIKTNGLNRQEVFNLLANPFTTTRPPVIFDDRQQFLVLRESFSDETLIADLVLEFGLGPVDLTSVTTYTDRSILVSRDATALTGSVSVDLGYPESAVLLPSNLLDSTEVGQVAQEVRLSSNGTGPLQWIVGAFYTDIQRDYGQQLPTPGFDAATDEVLGEGVSDAVRNGCGIDEAFCSIIPYSLKQIALFGEGTWDVTDRLHLTAGGRYYNYKESRTITTGGLFAAGDSGTVNKTSSNGFTPRFLASYDITDQLVVNAQAAKGFRLGGVNDPLNTTLCNPQDLDIFGGFQSYGDETLWNYEAGVKYRQRGLSFTAAAFHTDINDLQVTLDAGSCSSRISFNVPKAHTTGIELELSLEPIESLFLSFAGSLVEAEFDSTVRDSTGSVLGGVEEGNRMASVPKFQFATAATYSFPADRLRNGAEGFISASIQHVGSRFTQPGDQVPGAGGFVSNLPFGGAPGTDVTSLDLELDPYQTVNLNGGVDFDGFEVVAYATNLFDENANLSFDRERGGRARLGFRTNQPRTFGVVVRREF